jgi:repressor of nif and glnA expression
MPSLEQMAQTMPGIMQGKETSEGSLLAKVNREIFFIEDELQKLGSSDAARTIRYRLERVKELVKP